MNELLVSPGVRSNIEYCLLHPPQTLLIHGSLGAGKYTVARAIAATLLELKPANLENYAYFRHVTGQDSISIDSIREVAGFLRLKTIGSRPIRRVVLVEHAEYLTQEAQNAFLKMLEEPPSDTLLILTAPSPHTMLPTIVSRTQQIHVEAVPRALLEQHFRKRHSPAAIARAYYMSDGYIGLMTALLEKDTGHELAEQIQKAKELLGLTVFERLASIDTLAKDKTKLPILLTAFQKLAQAAVHQAADQGRDIRRWHERSLAIQWAIESLPHHPNVKLLLTDLLLGV